ncbi:hypothetical protein [Candidatus Odyssella thessalonicensis]|uniref:hypothetical protein n=1 Tax=Candidatus Odyssella thessalonicensis TaxID=84647 RepID=UPI001C2F5762|nr:hypothetical protein [Candidatus Odyssella thessalonicensis]
MEAPSSRSRAAKLSSQPSLYKLPDMVNKEQLVQSSVVVQCGTVRGGGVAISDKFILTAAHNLTGAVLYNAKVRCFAVASYQPEYRVPLRELFVNAEDNGCYVPDYHKTSSFRELIISRMHIHTQTSIREMGESEPRMSNLQGLLRTLVENLEYGLHSAEEYAANGWETEFINEGETVSRIAHIVGPDVALLECQEPHKLLPVEISEPLNDDRPLVHVVGIAGNRYADTFDTSLTGGTIIFSKNRAEFVFSPRIAGQRFKCLPAYPNNLKLWFNRPFLKIMGNKRYFIHNEVYPNAPEGFGLIRAGESGSGAFVVKEGKPYLVGVSCSGKVQGVFETIHSFLEQEDFDLAKIKHLPGGEILWKIYHGSLQVTDKDKKWYIAQALADVTHLKSWIDNIVNNAEPNNNS